MNNISQICNLLLEQPYLIRTVPLNVTEELSPSHPDSHSNEQPMPLIQNKHWASMSGHLPQCNFPASNSLNFGHILKQKYDLLLSRQRIFLLFVFLCFGIDKPLQIKPSLAVIFTVGQMLCKEGCSFGSFAVFTDQFKTACFRSIKSYNDKHYHCIVQIMAYTAFQT